MSRQSVTKVEIFCVTTGKLCYDMVGQARKNCISLYTINLI